LCFFPFHPFFPFFPFYSFSLNLTLSVSLSLYHSLFVCVCLCVCVCFSLSHSFLFPFHSLCHLLSIDLFLPPPFRSFLSFFSSSRLTFSLFLNSLFLSISHFSSFHSPNLCLFFCLFFSLSFSTSFSQTLTLYLLHAYIGATTFSRMTFVVVTDNRIAIGRMTVSRITHKRIMLS
jgi:hypothetical protein